jgi:hypothetical protein
LEEKLQKEKEEKEKQNASLMKMQEHEKRIALEKIAAQKQREL